MGLLSSASLVPLLFSFILLFHPIIPIPSQPLEGEGWEGVQEAKGRGGGESLKVHELAVAYRSEGATRNARDSEAL